jgi:AmmeMemoRadiSam system protein A
MDDPRFPPLSEDELEGVTIKISVLSPLKEISNAEEIEVGKHGVMIVQGGRRGVLLPEVPVSRGWDRETFLAHVCMKAGLPLDAWRNNPKLYTFTSNEFGEE